MANIWRFPNGGFDNAAAVPPRVQRCAGIVYKTVSARDLALDLYRSANNDEPRPLFVYFHGGYWKARSCRAHGQQGTEFVDMGYTMAAIEYRLSGEAPFLAAIRDICDALRWLTDNADAHAIDPTRIIFCGISAGGHLSAFTGSAVNNTDCEYGAGLAAD